MNLTLTDFFNKIETAFDKRQAFVVYKKPNQLEINVQIQLNNDLISKVDFEESGFIFAPFNNENQTIFFSIINAEIFKSDYSELDANKIIPAINVINKTPNKDFHLKLVAKAIEKIHLNNFEKVVISRKEAIAVSQFNLRKTYITLMQKYPSAMVYCWFHPEIGLWMGATPELLCKIHKNHFSTVALAGTKAVHENENLIWSSKEENEQQLVTEFILDELKFEIQNLKISAPYSVKAGHLWHIKTDIDGEIPENISIKKIIQKLHPTPAVCGLPKENAKDFILKNENYNREFYTGYLGEINLNKTTELFVNLRCMKIEDQNISIFVGGGITKDSIPENEWEETVAKTKTMKSCFY